MNELTIGQYLYVLFLTLAAIRGVSLTAKNIAELFADRSARVAVYTALSLAGFVLVTGAGPILGLW